MPFVGEKIKLLTTWIHSRGDCTACKDFTALGGNGVAGYLKMAYGASPIAHSEASFSQLWVDVEGALHVLKGDGSDAKVVMEENGQ